MEKSSSEVLSEVIKRIGSTEAHVPSLDIIRSIMRREPQWSEKLDLVRKMFSNTDSEISNTIGITKEEANNLRTIIVLEQYRQIQYQRQQ
jgi:hypothetical protein